ncbi:hypothetical protein [Streptomyces sp. NPDC054783]
MRVTLILPALSDGMRGMGRLWQAAGTVNSVLKPGLLERAVEAGLRSLFVGFETVNDANLAERRKNQNIGTDYAAAVRRLHEAGVMINAGFVFGLDQDGPDISASAGGRLLAGLPRVLPLVQHLAWLGAPAGPARTAAAPGPRGRLEEVRARLGPADPLPPGGAGAADARADAGGVRRAGMRKTAGERQRAARVARTVSYMG